MQMRRWDPCCVFQRYASDLSEPIPFGLRHFLYLFLLVIVPCYLPAETPPCGVAIIRTQGPKVDERFVPAPPDQVKSALLKALPAVDGRVVKEKGFHIEAKTDMGLRQVEFRENRDAGVRGRTAGWGALGEFKIDLSPATQDEVKGALLHIEFHKNAFVGRMGSDGYALPLAEETTCLVKLFSTNDPVANPRGLELKDAGPPHPVTLPDATPLKVLLRDPLYSKKLEKDSAGQTVPFEVAEDVVVDGVTLIRRGALAKGHFNHVEKTKRAGRHAEIGFAFDSVTTVDGQEIPVSGASETARGGRHSDTMSNLAQAGLFGLLAKGTDVFIRAGTAYDLEISGQHTVQAGR